MKNVFLLSFLLFYAESNFAENLHCIGEMVTRTSRKNIEAQLLKSKYDEVIEFGTKELNGKNEYFLGSLINNQIDRFNEKGGKEYSKATVFIDEKTIVGKYFFVGEYDNPRVNKRDKKINISINRDTGKYKEESMEIYSGDNSSSYHDLIEADCIKVERKF